MAEDLPLVSLSYPGTQTPRHARPLAPLACLALVVEALARALPDTLGAGGDWLVEADVREAVPGAAIVLPDWTAGGRDWPADPGPGVAVLAVLLPGGAVAVEETLEGE